MPTAPTLDGLSPTGKHTTAPGMDLFELASPNGLKHVALVVHEPWRQHAALGPDLQGRLAFMEQPEVAGLVRLARFDADSTTFVYPTGTVWSVAEVVRSFADAGAAPGVKAGLELCYLVAESLVEAAEAGFAQGVVGHGNVNPWTLFLKQDGQPIVLGYGIPQVELLSWRENQKIQLTEDSFRYAPPERVEGGIEDVSSDLLSLALVGLEVMTGRPVYDGVVADVRQQAARGEGVRRLYQWREKLPQNVREVMGRALKADPDTRFPSGMDFVHAVHDLLGSIEVDGPSLVEVMARVRASERRGRAAGKTGALSAAEMAELAADLEDFEDRPLPPPRRGRPDADASDTPAEKPRWSKAARKPEPTPAPAPEVERPRRRMRGDPPTGTVAAPPPAPPRADDAARERLKRRLRESAPSTGTVPRIEPERTPQVDADTPGLDLSAPDDVQLEPLTGKPPTDDADDDPVLEPAPPRADTGRVIANARARRTPAPASAREVRQTPAPVGREVAPPVPPPAPPEPRREAQREPSRELSGATSDVMTRPVRDPGRSSDESAAPGSPSAAAALLERLRTSGGRRRRPAEPASPPTPPPVRAAPAVAEPPKPEPAKVEPPKPVPPRVEPPKAEVPARAEPATPPPRAAAPRAEPPTPTPRPAAARAGEVSITVGESTVRVPAGPAREVAARVVAELALPLVDVTGRFTGVWRLFRGDRPLPGGAPVEADPELVLRRVRAGVRVVRIAFADGRSVELPIETGLPARWVLVGLAEWGLLGDPAASLWFAGRALEPAETLGEAFETHPGDPMAVPLVSVRPNRVS